MTLPVTLRHLTIRGEINMLISVNVCIDGPAEATARIVQGLVDPNLNVLS